MKVRQAPANPKAYCLTPKRFAEKSRLTRSFDFYRTARRQIDDCLEECRHRGWRRTTLSGAGELAEILVLIAPQHPVELVATYGAEEIGRAGALIMGCDRPCSTLGPAACGLVLLPDPRLFLPPDLYCGAFWQNRPDRRDLAGEFFKGLGVLGMIARAESLR